MLHRFLSLSLFVILLSCIKYWYEFPVEIGYDELSIDISDPESRLALNKKICLSTANPADLDLIPGVASKIKESLIGNKDKIKILWGKQNANEKFRAFILIQGCSAKTADRLERFIDVGC